MIKLQIKGNTPEEKELFKTKAKLINYSAFLEGLNRFSKAEEALQTLYKNIENANPSKLWDAEIDYALAEAQLEVFKASYKNKFDEDLKV